LLRIDVLEVTDRTTGETRHPDVISDALKDLTECDPDTPTWNFTWPLRTWIDPLYMMRVRMMQKMQLGRYGHQSVLQWDGVDVVDFRAWYNTLSDVVKEEHPAQTDMENTT
jgi:hypothetical protein